MAFKSILLTAIALVFSNDTKAAYIFSDVSITSNSVTFTIDGDMTGYTAPFRSDRFRISYKGDIYLDAPIDTYSANTWSSSIFDNEIIDLSGNTGNWLYPPYTWSHYSSNLADSVATNRTITVSFVSNHLDPTASGTIDFIWGNYASGTVLHTEIFGTGDIGEPPVNPVVPIPAAAWLFGFGLFSLVGVARRKKT